MHGLPPRTDHGVVGRLDGLVTALLDASPYRFTVAVGPAERDAAFRLRHEAVVERGWDEAATARSGREHDRYDRSAVIVVGRLGDEVVSTGRLVLAPGPLPTEQFCRITVEPAGRVVDVGRMVVARAHRDPGQRSFVALLCALYREARVRGYAHACGMMSPAVRTLAARLGLRLDVLGPDRLYQGEARAPVRFAVGANAGSLIDAWAAEAAHGAARTSEALTPPKPNELDKA